MVKKMAEIGDKWRKCMGIEPTQQLVTAALVLKTRRPTRRLGTSVWHYILTYMCFDFKLSPPAKNRVTVHPFSKTAR